MWTCVSVYSCYYNGKFIHIHLHAIFDKVKGPNLNAVSKTSSKEGQVELQPLDLFLFDLEATCRTSLEFGSQGSLICFYLTWKKGLLSEQFLNVTMHFKGRTLSDSPRIEISRSFQLFASICTQTSSFKAFIQKTGGGSKAVTPVNSFFFQIVG